MILTAAPVSVCVYQNQGAAHMAFWLYFPCAFAKKNTFCLDSVWILDPVLFPDLFRTAVEWIIDGNLTIHLQKTQWDSSESTKMKTTPSIVQQPWITVLPCTTKAVPRRKNYDPFKYQHTISSQIWFGLIQFDTTEMICSTNVATKWKWIAFHIIWSWKDLMINIWDLWHLIGWIVIVLYFYHCQSMRQSQASWFSSKIS